MNFTESLLKHIDKLVGTLRPEDELQEVLKRKFTKKEYKVFVAFEEGKSLDEIKTLIKDDDDKINEHYKVAKKEIKSRKNQKRVSIF